MHTRIVVALLLLLTSCIPKVEGPGQEKAAAAADPDKATLQCHAELRREGVEFRVLQDRTFSGGCSAVGAVQLLDIGTPVTNLGSMTCPLARQFARWTREAVQPAAGQWLKSRVIRVESFGTYACRPLNGVAGNKLSEHGRANAVDIAAFVLADGRRITVLEGWRSEDEQVRGFLRAVHQAGCRRFKVGLGPDANAYHANHFHFDMGQGPYCR
jgi:hypothetical protein